MRFLLRAFHDQVEEAREVVYAQTVHIAQRSCRSIGCSNQITIGISSLTESFGALWHEKARSGRDTAQSNVTTRLTERRQS